MFLNREGKVDALYFRICGGVKEKGKRKSSSGGDAKLAELVVLGKERKMNQRG